MKLTSAQIARVIAGDTRRNPDGYVLVYCPLHPAAVRSRVYEHRLIAERTLGRFLEPGEQVHHINGVVDDNRPENLQVVSSHEHQVLHGSGISNAEIARMLREGVTGTAINAMGVGTNRIVRARREHGLPVRPYRRRDAQTRPTRPAPAGGTPLGRLQPATEDAGGAPCA